jgi:hypothetical protein
MLIYGIYLIFVFRSLTQPLHTDTNMFTLSHRFGRTPAGLAGLLMDSCVSRSPSRVHLDSTRIINLWVWVIALHGRDTRPFWQLIIACKVLNGVFLSCKA